MLYDMSITPKFYGLYPGSQNSAIHIGLLLKKKLFLLWSLDSGFLFLSTHPFLKWWYAILVIRCSERKERKMCEVEMSVSEMGGAEEQEKPLR